MEKKQPILNFIQAIEIQTGGIVSKQIIKQETGNVTLFAFDKDQQLSEHTAPFDALVNILSGTASITINSEKHQLKTGEAVIMPANIPHALYATEPFRMLLTMIKKA